ncbi:2-succinyl-5-enolpyruvyl-6-hydroxy-3-cyclohexene-1-carboxylic-acid synthase [Opitutus sp. ER46]|uniref:2-succinyl-5-enolpyruvyl-6-hydroxy-3- cyclohexene-1-carboxylic-acid synthase n=1 Tax=Opitutus sp. ER46 TaxID=2161864 RepID=UPI000D3027C0|nr:2-succinyl-5-enolpyruvyl-6-hydroxy-3-cyclohexene-1-carboxylic-acid synthase [Opitutus sp. ER46]PTX94363.1 2-succinyl-5-enolpyruvyl-6-hydroxy-3-cyclohexene-1-carboxylic-acid synthase [Opitutus sp. ER46]
MNTEPVLDFRSTNALWASVLVETLVRRGVRRAVVSPGSRSTPLTIALARHPAMRAVPVLDERSAAFFALGLAKADLRPVVLVCTSGTAAANYFPAVIEAFESAVPLIVFTADRPPEMRACASGQTIDQQKLYGGYVGFYHELAVPELDLGQLRYLRQTVAHAAERTLQPQAGPVHLNVPFRDPLPPLPDGGRAATFAATVNWPDFFAQVTVGMRVEPEAELPELKVGGRGMIVVGPNQPREAETFTHAVMELARRLGWPVLADGLSPIRSTAEGEIVTTYDTILRSTAMAEQLAPEQVLAIGGWPTSKVLRTWLQSRDVPTWLLTTRWDNRDALHGRTRLLPTTPATLAAALPARPDAQPGEYEVQWHWAEGQVRRQLDQSLAQTTELLEPKAAWLLAQHLPEETPVFISNSMPIRDVEYVWLATRRKLRPLCNRGANGIDGTLSTALGVAEGAGRPTVLLTGDLALLHDTNGFLLRPQFRGSLTVVVINNNGGGIFEHLPVAQFDPPFEPFFATPQEADLGRLCAVYNVPHEEVRDWDHFVSLIQTLPARGLRVLELRTDRKRDAAWRKSRFAELAATLG